MRSAVVIFHTFLHLIAATPDLRTASGFECSEAGRPDEQAICNDDDLAQRDQLGSQVLEMLARRPATADAGLAEGRRFIEARRICGSDVDCIRREQDTLMVALVKIAGYGSRPAEAPVDPVSTPESPRFVRYAGASAAILLCLAFGWLERSKIAGWQRRRQAKANARLTICEVRVEARQRTRFRQGKLFNAHGFLLAQCAIRDRSKNGAKVRVHIPLERLRFVRFFDEAENIVVEAKVAWQLGNELGLAFRVELPAPVETSAVPAETIRSRSTRLKRERGARSNFVVANKNFTGSAPPPAPSGGH
jgi:uncharacterized protein